MSDIHTGPLRPNASSKSTETCQINRKSRRNRSKSLWDPSRHVYSTRDASRWALSASSSEFASGGRPVVEKWSRRAPTRHNKSWTCSDPSNHRLDRFCQRFVSLESLLWPFCDPLNPVPILTVSNSTTLKIAKWRGKKDEKKAARVSGDSDASDDYLKPFCVLRAPFRPTCTFLPGLCAASKWKNRKKKYPKKKDRKKRRKKKKPNLQRDQRDVM